jgi:photosystem I P700 chlorophyll a apoprotein A1
MYNSISVVIFHFSWKMQSDVWGTITPDGSISHITGGNFAPAIQPRALSITQGRAVGLAHYLLGGIGTTWSFFLARAISIT